MSSSNGFQPGGQSFSSFNQQSEGSSGGGGFDQLNSFTGSGGQEKVDFGIDGFGNSIGGSNSFSSSGGFPSQVQSSGFETAAQGFDANDLQQQNSSESRTVEPQGSPLNNKWYVMQANASLKGARLSKQNLGKQTSLSLTSESSDSTTIKPKSDKPKRQTRRQENEKKFKSKEDEKKSASTTTTTTTTTTAKPTNNNISTDVDDEEEGEM